MNEKTFIGRLEDVLEEMGLRTFEAPLTLDYRFGSIPAELGIFRCFVMQEDVMQAPNYLEMKGDHLYWVALHYPGLEELIADARRIAETIFKCLGRSHCAFYILALPEGLLEQERIRLETAFLQFRNSLPRATYHTLKIWDEREIEQRVAKNYQIPV